MIINITYPVEIKLNLNVDIKQKLTAEEMKNRLVNTPEFQNLIAEKSKKFVKSKIKQELESEGNENKIIEGLIYMAKGALGGK